MSDAVVLAMQLHHSCPGTSPLGVMYRTLRSRGIEVCYVPLPSRTCGYVDCHRGRHVIMVNADDPRARQNFTIAHELYHILAGHEPSMLFDEGDYSDPEERAANKFAACLLMPPGPVRRMIDRGCSAVDIARVFHVSIDAAQRRIAELRHMT